MKSHGLFFDLDGTLVDTLPDIAGVVNRMRGDYGLSPLPEPEVARFVGRGVECLMTGCFADHHGEIPLEDLVDGYRRGFLRSDPAGRLYPGVRETLGLFKERGYRLGVVTNRLSELAEKTLRLYLPELAFDVILGPDRVPRPKPDPAHLRLALERTEVAPENACFVGDHEVDLACARAAGVAFRGASYGLSGVLVPPEERLGSFAELPRRLPWKSPFS